jgi:hypothetical protein
MSMTPKDPTRPRVVLHVGAPKSGTTFLQRALWKNRSALADAGYLLPGANAREMFLAAIEVRETHETWGFQRAELAGTWQRLAREARGSARTTIMSHELLAAATDDQIAAALEELGGTDVHVVFTARDLGRQVVSEWQERIKNGSDSTFDEFERRITKRIRDRDFGSLFWRYQDLPGVLERWAGHLPPGNVHIVVAPPPGADPSELWRRFGDAVGFDADALDPSSPAGAANQTLGVVSISILRQVNEALQGRIVQPTYARVVKRYLGQDLLTRHSSPRPVCPPDLQAALRQLSEEWTEQIGERGYAVHGDLAELLPTPAVSPAPPDDVDLRDQATVSAAVIADLLVEVAELRGRVRRLSRQADARPAQTAGLPRRLRRRARGLVHALVHR